MGHPWWDGVEFADRRARFVRDTCRIVRQYCIECHGSELQEAELRLDQFQSQDDSKARDVWHRAWRQMQSGAMPPDDAPQPPKEERRKVLDWIVSKFGEVELRDARDHWSFKSVVRQTPPAEIDAGGSRDATHPIDAFVAERLRQDGLSLSPAADRRTLIRRLTLDLTGLLPSAEEVDAFLSDPDDDEVAFERVMQRLLDSPRYGERWAQHWLDVIRWAETVGFETNAERREAWHFRDWVIRSLNDDLPYNEFIAAQLIGDSLGEDAALGFLVAGPANLPGQIGRDDEAMRQARQDELDEVIRTVSQSLFGMTIGCARCHDHKFDPITQRDYYSMQAVFAGLRYGTRRLRGDTNDAWAAKVPAARERLAELKKELDSIRKRFDLREPIQNVQTETFPVLRADAVRMEIEATASGVPSLYELEVWTAGGAEQRKNVALASSGAVPSASSFALANQTRHFDNLVDGSVDRRQAFPWVAASGGPAWVQVDLSAPVKIDRITWHNGSSVPVGYEIKARVAETGQWKIVAHTRDRLPRTDDLRAAANVQIEGLEQSDIEPLFALLASIRKQERDLNRFAAGPQAYAASFASDPEATKRLHRGDPMQPREEVIAAAPAFLVNEPDAKVPATELDRRRMLVAHLTRGDHPLTARVMVNRIWQHHFGTGLVETSSDFGQMGASPSHPELLDWLAVEFVQHGWSIKHVHRLIVSSRTYRQSSRPRDEATKIDAGSRLLWRYPPRRLDAEAIRDSVLMASGKLNLKMYGRGFDFFNQRGGLSDYHPKETFEADGWRRMIYAHKIRMQSIDVFGAFDCPDAGQMTPRRGQSITPVQSIGLFNSPFINRQAAFFAERVLRESGGDVNRAIRRAFEIALARAPTAAEQNKLAALADDHGMEQVCRVIFNTSEFVFLN